MPTLSLCSAYNCKNRSPKAGVGFFRFPKNDPERRKQWIINMKCKGLNPQQNHCVCSVHFEDKYICGRDIRQRLTPDAVPTIFDYPKNFQKSITWPVKDVAPKVACENMEFQLPPLKHIIEIKEAWEWLIIDIRGPLPLTLNGHQYVLTLTDFYSKWVEAFPLRSCSSTEVAQHVAEVISHFGFPFGILVRLKKNFTSKINVALKSRLKLRGFSLLYRHRQVGSLDLATQTQISRMVSDLVNDHPYNWDVCLPAKVFSLCFKEHPKTKQRPFSLLSCKGPQPVTTPRDLSTWLALNLGRKRLERTLLRGSPSLGATQRVTWTVTPSVTRTVTPSVTRTDTSTVNHPLKIIIIYWMSAPSVTLPYFCRVGYFGFLRCDHFVEKHYGSMFGWCTVSRLLAETSVWFRNLSTSCINLKSAKTSCIDD